MISFASESKVYVDGKLVHGDAIRLDRDLVNVKDNMYSLQKTLEYTKALGSCVFIGPQFRELKWKIQEKVKSLSDPSDGFTVSASVLNQPLCDGVVIKLLAAQSTEQARSFFRSVIEDTREWLGSNPLEK
nr:uncharacterized protein LOC131786829 [Pocillopora verrucosa]